MKSSAWTIIIIIILIVAGIIIFKKGNSTQATSTTSNTNVDMTLSPNNTATSTATTTPAVSTSTASIVGTVKEFTVTGSSFKFTPATLTVKKGDTVKINFKNSGGLHDFVIDEFSAATPRINSGKQTSITFVADKAGTFEYYCSVGTHRAMGMKGTLTVTQ